MLEQDGRRLLFDPFLTRGGEDTRALSAEFSAAETILVTHGHFDHISDIPAVLGKARRNAAVYCTAAPKQTLISLGVDGARIRAVSPGDVFDFAPFSVRVLEGSHIVFDLRLIAKTLINPRIVRYRDSFLRILKENKKFPEAGETVIFEITAEGARVILLGSLGLDDGTAYPIAPDLLIMPLAGRSDADKLALRLVERIRPKRVLLDHTDDAFPPITSEVQTGPFTALMKERHPHIPIVGREAYMQWVDI